jgi:MoaA/NifB/PqqE/SkfB family radical SAM enzyme
MDNKKIFCTVPWFEVHVNADGTYHTCGAQPTPSSMPMLPGFTEKNNVHSMHIQDWVNGEYQKKVRLDKLNGVYEKRCLMCYSEEATGSVSKRIKENLKSKIYDVKFDLTYKHSPDLATFEFSSQNQGLTDIVKPLSYHLNLGNECNYACKMCGPACSSKLAVEGIKDGTYSGPAKINWTEDTTAWNSVTDYICNTENLKYVHIIGGEPLLNPRFEELIDKLIAAGRTDIYFGFTTNGSIVNIELIKKLNVFRQVDIGISIECTGILNDYVRKGTCTTEVLDNIDIYLKYRKESHVYITVRTVPSALSVGTLDSLYAWCVTRRLDVMTNLLVRPDYLQIKNLPLDVKQRLINQYEQWEHSKPIEGSSDPRDPNRFKEHIDNEINAVLRNLKLDNDPVMTTKLYDMLKKWNWLSNPEVAKYFETK